LLEGYGVQVLISAVPIVLKEISNLQVYIIGTGEFFPYLKKQVNNLGLSHIVKFTGNVPINLIPHYIKSATVGIVPLLKDGYMELCAPNKLFEYVALKKPVIAADVAGIRAYFNEEQVEFFKPGDPEDLARKVIYLLKNPQRRSELVQEAWKVYENIRWEKTKLVYLKSVKYLL
jgi:glycosyltransferase involved in cell wall biosynthesis